MTKRSRRRRPKRTSRGETAQLDQRLSRRARELLEGEAGRDEHEGDELDDGALDEFRAPARPGRVAGQEDGGVESDPALPLRRGRIVGLWSGGGRLESEEGEELECVLPSRLARDQASAVAVGDHVTFQDVAAPEGGEALHRVRQVLPRRTALARPDPQNPRQERVIAANVDRVVIVASVRRPPLKPALVDRYLLIAERGGARPLVCVNKVDLLGEDEREAGLAALDPFRELGIPVVPCSARTGEGIAALRELLREPLPDGGEPTAVFVGHGGVGKSSLLNALHPALAAAVGEVDGGRAGKGRHTTTRSALFRLDGCRVVDTPGIRELGLGDLTAVDLRAGFPDLAARAVDCRFGDCTHVHEPGCAVKAAVEAGELSAARFASYRRILESLGL